MRLCQPVRLWTSSITHRGNRRRVSQRMRCGEVQACIAMPPCAGQALVHWEHGSDACTCTQVPKATCLLLKALAEWIAAQLEPRANPTARAIIAAELRALVDIPPIPAEDSAGPGKCWHPSWSTSHCLRDLVYPYVIPSLW